MTPHPQSRLVVHVIDSLGDVGGAEQQLVQQLARFSDGRLRHEVACLFEAPLGQSRRDLLPADVAVHHLFAVSDRRPSRWEVYRRLERFVADKRPDLVHCSLPDASLASRLVCRRHRLPLVETLVNISHEGVRTRGNPNVTPFKLGLHRLLDRATMRSVTRFQAISPAVAHSWSRVVGIDPRRMTVIPRGIDTEAFVVDRDLAIDHMRQELALPAGSFVILNLGREQPQKGQRFLIDAMPLIRRDLPGAVLLLAGSPGLESAGLRRRSEELGLQAVVHFLGRRHDVPRLMAASDAFVFPSLFEGLGVAMLEAMAAALPVVTTDRPPMNEVVVHGENGLLVTPESDTAIARAVIELAGDPGLARRLGQAGRQTVIKTYAVESVIHAIEEMYAAILGIQG